MLLVGAYGLLRTVGVPDAVLLVWTAFAAALTVVSLLAGVTILAAIGPFTEAVTDDGRITAVPFLLVALGVGVLAALVRAALAGKWPRPPVAVLLGALLFLGTLMSVALTLVTFGTARGAEALQLWVPGVGGGLTVFFAAWLVGRSGEHRPLIVLVVSVALAAALSVADFITAGGVRDTAAGWLLRPHAAFERLTGIIPAPNAAAAIFLGGLAMAAAGSLFAQAARVRLAAAAASAVLLAATLLTQSRSALLALIIVAAILAWRLAGWRAVAVVGAIATAGVAAAALVPGIDLIRAVPLWADEARLAAWSAAVAMWLDAPLIGHGFRSFEWLHAQYGSTLNAPHNEWLRLLAEGGLFFAITALAFFGSVLVVLLRTRVWLAAGSAAAAAGLVVMATFNNPFIYVQVVVPLFLATGAGVGLATLRPPVVTAAVSG